MNDSSVSEVAKGKLAAAVRDFVPRMSRQYQKLLTLREGIVELRHKGASYRTIVDILRNIDVPVSHSTLARFCRDVLEQQPARKYSRTPSVPKPSHSSAKRKKETGTPRIADPNNV
jgi:hypothetical protein